MDIQTKHIDRLKSEHTCVEIHTDNYGIFEYGFIRDFNENFLVLEKSYSDYFYDKIAIFMRKNITRIRWGGSEMTNRGGIIDSSQQQDKVLVDLTSMRTILQSVQDASEHFEHITVYIEDIDAGLFLKGQIHEVDSKYLVIYDYGTEISMDRNYVLIALDDITRVDANGHPE